MEKTSELLVASPFITNDFEKMLHRIDLSNLRSIVLLTTLVENDIDQIHKVKSFISLQEFAAKKNINIRIYVNNKLHGKVYLFRNGSTLHTGIVTSANFTDNGLQKNLEWGVLIDQRRTLQELESDIFSNPWNILISQSRIDKIISLFHAFELNQGAKKIGEKDSIALNLLAGIGLFNRPETGTCVNFWLKPIGVSDSPVEEGKDFSSEIERLEFSTIKPVGIKEHDIVIAYGVGTRKVLSIYKIVSPEADYVTEEELGKDEWRERWPWSLDGRNLSKRYGKSWWKNDFYITGLAEQFAAQFPSLTVTHRGSRKLGGLNYGKDKIRLTSQFANFVIKRIFEAEEELG